MSSELSDLPEDVLEELEEARKEVERELRAGRKRKRRYPTARDIAEAVREVALSARGADPAEFPEMVREHLERQGFYAGLVTDKRVWRVYETLVRRGVIPDTLGVVEW